MSGWEKGSVTSKKITPLNSLRDWLKEEHGLGSVTAHFIAFEALKPKDYVDPSGDDLLGAQFAGDRERLRPIYDAVVTSVGKLGKDVEVAVRKTQTTLSRGATFAVVFQFGVLIQRRKRRTHRYREIKPLECRQRLFTAPNDPCNIVLCIRFKTLNQIYERSLVFAPNTSVRGPSPAFELQAQSKAPSQLRSRRAEANLLCFVPSPHQGAL